VSMSLTAWPVMVLAQGGGAAGPDGAPAVPAGPSVLDYIHSGGLLSYLLVGVSVLALGLIIANVIQLRRERVMPLHVVGGLERLIRDRNLGEAIRFCGEAENDSFLARVIGGGLTKAMKMPPGSVELRSCLEEAGAREVDRLERVTQGIGILAAVGPMMGLLGTVIGMIGAFATIGAADKASRSDQLAGFMSIALVTTAEGLVIAIPCTIAFALFKRRLDRLVADAADTAERIVAPLLAPVARAMGPAAGGAGAPAVAAAPAARPAGVATAAGAGGGAGARPAQASTGTPAGPGGAANP
jgi:biopolymer transport protein ExbB